MSVIGSLRIGYGAIFTYSMLKGIFNELYIDDVVIPGLSSLLLGIFGSLIWFSISFNISKESSEWNQCVSTIGHVFFALGYIVAFISYMAGVSNTCSNIIFITVDNVMGFANVFWKDQEYVRLSETHV